MTYRTKEEQVADYLRERIISGVLARGSRLKQGEIAELLHLSVTPVREALKLLVAEGYVCGDAYRGARVAPFDPTASAEIFHLRLMLEAQLVRGAVEKLGSRDIMALQALAEAFATACESGDEAGARGLDYRLHRRLYGIADMPQTLHFVQILWARYPLAVFSAAEAIREHEEILQAMTSGDAAEAMLAMRRHIESGWAALKSGA